MFSGLTNQVSSWMGAAKGEPQDEEVPTPTKDIGDGGSAEAGEKTNRYPPFLYFSLPINNQSADLHQVIKYSFMKPQESNKPFFDSGLNSNMILYSN